MNTTECVLPLSCSCSNCDWNLCTMKTKISKDILVCCCGEKPRSKQLVYTCTTKSNKEAAKSIKSPEICCQHKSDNKIGNERNDKKYKKSKSSKKNLRISQKDKIDKKKVENKSLENEKVDCMCKGRKEKHGIFSTKSKNQAKKSDLYSKIEEIYKICCCEACYCPSPPLPQEESLSDTNCLTLESEKQKVCLCIDSHEEDAEINKGNAACECPTRSEIFKPCLCDTVNMGPQITTPLELLPSSCKQDNKQPDITSPKIGLNSPRNSKTDLSSQKHVQQSKDLKGTEIIMTPKPACGQFNSPCPVKQEKEVKIILTPQQEKKQTELGKYQDDHKEVDMEVKSTNFPICDGGTPLESLSLVCSCADSDISEDGNTTCACQPDDKKEGENLCEPSEISTKNLDEIAGTEGDNMCKCTTCECIDCPNAHIRDKVKNKAKGGTRKLCKCTNCLMTTCQKHRHNCLCKRKRTDPNKHRKYALQTNNYDVHRTLLCENLPFNKTVSKMVCDANRVSTSCLFKDNSNKTLRECYLCKNYILEYENILGEVDHCKCSPCECQFCHNINSTGLRNNKACRCTKCECISCSNYCDGYKQYTNHTNSKNIKCSQDIVKSDCNDIMYENLTLLKRGGIITNFKTDKEQLVNDQLRLGLNKDLPLPYVIIDDKIKVINTDIDTIACENSIGKSNKEKVNAQKNVSRRANYKNSKECLNFLIPSNSEFIKRLTISEPGKIESVITNKEEAMRNFKIYVQLKNTCDNVDEYIKYLKNILEKSKKDDENFESVIEKIKTETVPRVLELIRKEHLKKETLQLQ